MGKRSVKHEITKHLAPRMCMKLLTITFWNMHKQVLTHRRGVYPRSGGTKRSHGGVMVTAGVAFCVEVRRGALQTHKVTEQILQLLTTFTTYVFGLSRNESAVAF